ncbi:MAG TPA: glutathione S-transferase family protein [Nannocystis exedens]|nr:glutathione S-transferase family protein [Nannocystis exedens]
MPSRPQHFGWLVSPYTAKTRSYLAYKGIDVDDRVPGLIRLGWTIRRAVGRVIMPTVRLPNGTWLQDSSVILDHFEALSPKLSITPSGAVQRLASALIDLFADEWLPMAALHYRWSIPANKRFALHEFASSALPHLPGPLALRLVRPMAAKMQSYLPLLGVTSTTAPGVEETVQQTLQAAEQTLCQHPYLLGDRPCTADFSLFGPLWAHLYRDPGTTALFDPFPALVRWMKRLQSGSHPEIGDFLPNDQIPTSLLPLFDCILQDQLPWIHSLVHAIDAYCESHANATRVPRSLGTAGFQIRGREGERKLVTFVQWKAQRARQAYEDAAGKADSWLATAGSTAPQQTIPTIAHPLKIVDFKPVLV